MRQLINLVISSILIASCSSNTADDAAQETEGMSSIVNTEIPPAEETSESVQTSSDTAAAAEEYTYEIVDSESGGYGYQIFLNGKLNINQPHVPAVAGRAGFDDEESAATTANFIINKLENGIFPPTISIEEMDSLGVLN